jgi:hypothetical protein
MRSHRVELLYVEGCPNREPTRALVEHVAAELGVAAGIELVEVADPEEAVALRFLGSPTVRIDGRDVEPGADARREFALSCRLYETGSGPVGRPEQAWIHEALARIGG